MNSIFNSATIEDISKLLGKSPEAIDNVNNYYAWSIDDEKYNAVISLTIYIDVQINNTPTTLVSVHTMYGYYELHNVTNWDIFPPDELIFVSENSNMLSSLTVSKNRGVSLLSNISKEVLDLEITELDAPLLFASSQLRYTTTL